MPDLNGTILLNSELDVTRTYFLRSISVILCPFVNGVDAFFLFVLKKKL